MMEAQQLELVQCRCCDRQLPAEAAPVCGWCRRHLRCFVLDPERELVIACASHGRRLQAVSLELPLATL